MKSVTLSENSKKRPLSEYNDAPFFHYIGETSRSAYERGHEHLKDLEFRRTKSHYLRHAVEFHPNVPPESLKFRMKILSCHKTAFERQIREAVLIDLNSGPKLMNSKLEYTRCCIPKLSVKLGNKDEKEDPQVSKEKSAVEKIKLLYKGELKRPKNSENRQLDQRKRAKIDVGNDRGADLGPKVVSEIACDANTSENVELRRKDEVTKYSSSFDNVMGCPSNQTLHLAQNVSPNAQNKSKSENKCRNKVQRGEIKLKLSPLKLKCSSKSKSTSPDLGTKNGSPNPDIGTQSTSTGLNTGTQIIGQRDEMKKKVLKSDNVAVEHSCQKGFNSPSLKPVKVKRLIDAFEDNAQIKSKIDAKIDANKGQKEIVTDAFRVLMMSRSGDTPKKTPKRKPKRLAETSTGKRGTLLEKWMKQ